MVVKCRDCGTEFVISEEEKEWYENKNFVLPTRCKDCRQKRRQNNNNSNNNKKNK